MQVKKQQLELLGSSNREKESKMAVAKRQEREKPGKTEQRKVKGRSEGWSEDLRKNKQHSWLSPICIGQVQGEKKNIKGGAQVLSLSLSVSLHHGPNLHPLAWPDTDHLHELAYNQKSW